MNRIRRIGIVAVVGLAVFATVASGSSSVKTQSNGSSSGSTSPSSGGASTSTTAAVAHTGGTITLKGQDKIVDVTLVKVIDPAQGASEFATPDSGKRFVGAEFQIKNTGTGTFDDDANNDASVIGSDNQTYTADMNDIAGCTNFNSGSVTLAPGESATGCVNFQVPSGVTVVKVRFAANMGLGADTGEWVNP
jgi:hypothetical protein